MAEAAENRDGYEPRLKRHYREVVVPQLKEQFGYTNPMVVPRLDNFGPLLDPTEVERAPELYSVGCAGRIDRSETQPDGRYEIMLRGICRFRIREELPERRGSRRMSADYADFLGDLTEPQSFVDPSRILAALRAFGPAHGLELDFDLLRDLPGISLLNGLAVALPFRPEEKQALLETPGAMERERLLLALMGMGIEPSSTKEYYSPPTVH